MANKACNPRNPGSKLGVYPKFLRIDINICPKKYKNAKIKNHLKNLFDLLIVVSPSPFALACGTPTS